MFNRFVKATRSVFSFRSERQLQLPDRTVSPTSSPSESAQKADNMVTTRSKADHAEQNESIKDSGQKRKRPRKQDEPQPSKKSKSGVSLDPLRERRASGEMPGHAPKDAPELPIRSHSDNAASVQEQNSPQSADEAAKGSETSNSELEKKSAKPTVERSPASYAENYQASKSFNDATTQQSNHVRFDSEDPPSRPLLEAGAAPEPIIDDTLDPQGGTSSDDEAPETVTAAQSRKEARASERGAKKAIRSQEQSRKDVRRKKDAQLREQAQAAASKSSKKDKKTAEPKPSDTADQLVRDILQSGEIPDMLPPEILSAERTDLALMATVANTSKDVAKSKPAKKASQKSKDVVRGDRLVRIFDPYRDAKLPTPSSKDVREGWLAGIRGRHDTVASHRKPIHRSFLRG